MLPIFDLKNLVFFLSMEVSVPANSRPLTPDVFRLAISAVPRRNLNGKDSWILKLFLVIFQKIKIWRDGKISESCSRTIAGHWRKYLSEE